MGIKTEGRGKDMANSCLHILKKNTATRCQTAFYYFGLSKGVCTQQFMKERILSDELYIVNNMDVFSISDNGITLSIFLVIGLQS